MDTKKLERIVSKQLSEWRHGYRGGVTNVPVTPDRQKLFEDVKAAGMNRGRLVELLGEDRATWYMKRRAGGGGVFDSLAGALGWSN
jgi:hypothetical protein